LLVAKTLAAVLSGSLAVISSVLDSAVDLVSGILLWISSRAIKKTDISVYPRGRGRLEPVSIVVLAVIMSLASCQVVVNSIKTILTYVNYDLHCSLLPTILICLLTIVIKFVMYVVCRRMSNVTIQALAQDHRNDVISNTVALSFGFMGYKLLKYIDPTGAILISLYVIITWSLTAMEQIKVITGYTADPTLLNAFTWFIVRHHPDIKYIDDIRAFHQSAEGFIVEADIILPSNMGLKESHDIGENLKKRLERLPEVERAFVHVDYACNKYNINPNLMMNSYL
ncbi:hypothetical protein HELRODRAFT_70308, partial [Helobdella robusta]|uniref:Uncharacterized protein n=1 Tax=Helobdella robusta TaxID=6412 RepID=T1G044_HELRO